MADSKLPAAIHPTPEAVAWVARWERLHLRVRSEVKSGDDGLRKAIRKIYAVGGLPPPARIEIASNPKAAIQAWLRRRVTESYSEIENYEDTFSSEEARANKLHERIFGMPMAKLSRKIGDALGRIEAPDDRELFGAAGAMLSQEMGIRVDPVSATFLESKHFLLQEVIERIAASLAKENSPPRSWGNRFLDGLSEEQMSLMSHIAARRELPFVGNQETGVFRRFGYLAQSIGERVDFGDFAPWQLLAENTHFVAFGWSFAIICPLPTKLHGDSQGLRAEWENLYSGMKWARVFRAE